MNPAGYDKGVRCIQELQRISRHDSPQGRHGFHLSRTRRALWQTRRETARSGGRRLTLIPCLRTRVRLPRAERHRLVSQDTRWRRRVSGGALRAASAGPAPRPPCGGVGEARSPLLTAPRCLCIACRGGAHPCIPCDPPRKPKRDSSRDRVSS